jgi:putative endonuclease
MKYYVYILQCADDTLYTGVTKDLEKRLAQHNSGRGARYTRGRLPVTLVYQEESSSIKSAMEREREIRRLPRSQKQKLIEKGQATFC